MNYVTLSLVGANFLSQLSCKTNNLNHLSLWMRMLFDKIYDKLTQCKGQAPTQKQ